MDDYDPLLGDELEGIDFWDLDSNRPPRTPSGMRGQLHMLQLENGLSSDTVSLRHFGVSAGSVDAL